MSCRLYRHLAAPDKVSLHVMLHRHRFSADQLHIHIYPKQLLESGTQPHTIVARHGSPCPTRPVSDTRVGPVPKEAAAVSVHPNTVATWLFPLGTLKTLGPTALFRLKTLHHSLLKTLVPYLNHNR